MSQGKGARTRAAVVAAARRHFSEQGYEGATGAMIAADAGVTEPTIQFHFGSKAGLLVAVMRDYYDDLLAQMQTVLDDAQEPTARLERFAVWWLTHNAAHVDLLAVFGRHGRGPASDEVVIAFTEANRRVTRAFDRLVEDARRAGHVRPEVATRVVRDAFFGGAEHVMVGRAMTGRPIDLAAAARELLDLLIGGAAPRASELRLATLTFDALDPESLGAFWAELLYGRVVPGNDPPETLVVVPESSATLLFLPVADPTEGKNRCHPDLHTPNFDEEVGRALALGATLLAEHQETSRWKVLADPEGNEFCIVERLGASWPQIINE